MRRLACRRPPRAFPLPPPSLHLIPAQLSLPSPRPRAFSSLHLRPHLDLRSLASDPSLLSAMRDSVHHRGLSVDVDHVLTLYTAYNAHLYRTEQLRHQRNTATQAIAQAPSPSHRAYLIAEAKRAKEELAVAEATLVELRDALDAEATRLPNRLHPSTPLGPEGSGRIVDVVGPPPHFPYPPLDHLALSLPHDLVDFPTAALTTGSRFYFLKHELALLELALVQFSLHHLTRAGFSPLTPPDLVQRQFVYATGFQPRDERETQVYDVEGGLALVGTAEIPLAAYYVNRQLPSAPAEDAPQWPILHCGFSHCFRTEAGGHGKENKGLYRVHQFSKVEMFALCPPALSPSTFELLLSQQRALLDALQLHYRVVDIPSGDLGASASRKTDVEVWMPGRGRWGEVTSASDCEEYQSRRLNVRYKEGGGKEGGGGKWRFVHTLNGTACAVPRMIIGIMEQHQREDGTVSVPEALRPYMMGIDTIPSPLVKRVHQSKGKA